MHAWMDLVAFNLLREAGLVRHAHDDAIEGGRDGADGMTPLIIGQ